ncbi:zinc-ribbon domain-containing protein [Arthrobacter sp. ISL-28]|uniref:zinc-ribbon domain-containing protein n=1 Tax=Arthrobacter sp. ISL-28 TaxID=2819108 RepID=UPI001BEAAAAE|nr:zinc-ribbon domain-containing protein [Arthrobacter sp. ISL-28]MBT2521145.1 zinc-ribbon domain-containing protein [Arthrobacter sp. ISL-28]
MIFIFGLSSKFKALPSRAATCQYCQALVQHYPDERATRLTLFFIPVFTTSRSYHVTCSNCGQRSTISGRQKKALNR